MTGDNRHPQYQGIARDYSELDDSTVFDTLVVGSGYGGGISASRMARLGKKVCLLERGREILPGEYPATLTSVQNEFQLRTDSRPDSPIGLANGLFDFRMNEDMSVLIGCGLGGTSLINANVSLETDDNIVQHKDSRWPAVFRDNPQELRGYYEVARKWLGAKSYPESAQDYPSLNKLDALRKAAQVMDLKFIKPPLNVNFTDLKDNGHGLPQPKCNLCGDCCSGCNHGAKNTTLMNYLPDAKNKGAEIFCNSSVDYLEQQGDVWHVYVFNTADTSSRCVVKAQQVILAAGTLGSTEIMLRSRARGLRCSDTMGQGFSGNGDVLAFGYNSYWKDNDADRDDALRPDDQARYESVYAVGQGCNELQAEQLPGPCITGCIDMRESHRPVADHRVIEEGVIPGALANIIPAGFFFAAAQKAGFLKYGNEQARLRLQDIKQLGEAIQNGMLDGAGHCYQGPVSRSMTYLCMSVDDAGGRLEIPQGSQTAVVKWPGVGSQTAIKYDNDVINEVCDSIESQYLGSPLWDRAFNNKLITVHPLGGCCMADSAEQGVVNADCQVYCDTSGSAVYDGLYICDGAVIPGAVAVNPLLTISAVTERACAQIAKKENKKLDTRFATPIPGPIMKQQPAMPAPVVHEERFTEATALDKNNQALLNILLESPEIKKHKSITGLIMELFKTQQKDVVEFEHFLQTIIAVFALLKKEQIGNELLVVFSMVCLSVLAAKTTSRRKDQRQDVMSQAEKDLWHLLTNTTDGLLTVYAEQFSPWMTFTETMTGYLSQCDDGELCDKKTSRLVSPYRLAWQQGKAAKQHAVMTATIKLPDVNAFIEAQPEPEKSPWQITAFSLAWPGIGVLQGDYRKEVPGSLNVLVADVENETSWIMEYQVDVIDENDTPMYFYGRKTLSCRPGSHWWTDLSTLEVSIYKEKPELGKEFKPLAIGLLELSLQEFMHQMASLTSQTRYPFLSLLIEFLDLFISDKSSDPQQLIARYFTAKLAGIFGLIVFRAYGGLLVTLQNLDGKEHVYRQQHHQPRPLHAPAPEIYPQLEGEKFRLTRYRGEGIPVILVPGMGVNAGSFATPSVDENLVEYLSRGTTRANRDVWLLDYRASFDSGHSMEPFSIDDISREDWPLALKRVLTEANKSNTGEDAIEQVQIIAHCVGSMTLLMGLLAGHIDKQRIHSIISSQLTLHPVTNWLNNAKADIDLTAWLQTLPIIRQHNGTVSMVTGDTGFDHEMDVACYQVPVPQGEECNNPCCRRIFSVYGPSFLHRQLNYDTHLAMPDWFKDIHLKPFEQLSRIIRKGYVVDKDGNNTYLTRANLAKGGLDLPITFIAGALNLEFLPETSARTYAWLQAHYPDKQSQYQRYVFEGYGHMDCFIGKNAARDIFPKLYAILENFISNDIKEDALACEE